MAVNYQEVNDLLRAWIVQTLNVDGRTVQPVRQNQAKLPPKNPDTGQLLTVALLNQNPIGWDTSSYKNQDLSIGIDLDETMYGDRKVTCRIVAYGEESINLVEELTLKTLSARSLAYLNANNLGYIDRSDVLSLPRIEQANFEERHQVDYDFHYVISATEEVNAVASVVVGANYVWGRDYSSETLKNLINITSP